MVWEPIARSAQLISFSSFLPDASKYLFLLPCVDEETELSDSRRAPLFFGQYFDVIAAQRDLFFDGRCEESVEVYPQALGTARCSPGCAN